jgi:pimeloyl-ACP methyl ester carboxylesterase
VVLLGTGIGGSMVLEYIQHHAGSIDAIILHAPVGTRLDSRRFPQLMNLPGARTAGQWLFASPLTRPLFKRLLFIDHTRVPTDTLNRFFAEYRQAAAFGQMFDLITPEWYASLQPVEIPAGLLWGQLERVLKIDHVEDYKALLPNHIVRIVPGWDHFPMLEQPAEYAREIARLARELLDRG